MFRILQIITDVIMISILLYVIIKQIYNNEEINELANITKIIRNITYHKNKIL